MLTFFAFLSVRLQLIHKEQASSNCKSYCQSSSFFHSICLFVSFFDHCSWWKSRGGGWGVFWWCDSATPQRLLPVVQPRQYVLQGAPSLSISSCRILRRLCSRWWVPSWNLLHYWMVLVPSDSRRELLLARIFALRPRSALVLNGQTQTYLLCGSQVYCEQPPHSASLFIYIIILFYKQIFLYYISLRL